MTNHYTAQQCLIILLTCFRARIFNFKSSLSKFINRSRIAQEVYNKVKATKPDTEKCDNLSSIVYIISSVGHCITLTNSATLADLRLKQRVRLAFANLGLVGFDFGHSTTCPVLLGQNWPCCCTSRSMSTQLSSVTTTHTLYALTCTKGVLV